MHTITDTRTRIERRLLRQLKAFPGNPRVHSKRQLGKLARTIGELGFLGVIVIDEQDRILAGHARWQAAQIAGLEIVDCLIVEHLSEARKRAFVLADNRIALDAVWDIGKVNAMIADIQMGDLDIDLLSTAEQNQAIGRRKSRPLGAAGVERREGVARPEFLACSVGVFVGVSLPFGRGFGRDDSCRRSSRGC